MLRGGWDDHDPFRTRSSKKELRDEASTPLVLSLSDAVARSRLDRLDELVTEDFTRHGGFGPADSRAKLRSVIEGGRGFYRDLHIELHGVVANADKGAMRWRFTGGWGETRFAMESVNFGMYHFRDGKISDEWILGNRVLPSRLATADHSRAGGHPRAAVDDQQALPLDGRHRALRLLPLELDAPLRLLLDVRLRDGHEVPAVRVPRLPHACAVRARRRRLSTLGREAPHRRRR
ncbi:MAG: nuclear transport factor 2 family protein [bacterium]|nr:nuclear transport factor 2 family protein [bacterium]